MKLAGFCFLLVVLSLQLFFSVRRESQTWDEAIHIFAGYQSWTDADFGLNPEHPPLLKLISASNLSGLEFGPGSLDPYGQFKLLQPTAVIDRGVFVFDGKLSWVNGNRHA
jgi:hypothetical protein